MQLLSEKTELDMNYALIQFSDPGTQLFSEMTDLDTHY